jgi:hypothetical protein
MGEQGKETDILRERLGILTPDLAEIVAWTV